MNGGGRASDRVLAQARRRAELGWRLQLVRAAIWESSATGDDYARVLLDAHDDADAVRQAMLGRPVVASVTGAIVVSDPEVAIRVLADDAFRMHDGEGRPALLQAMQLPGAGLERHGAQPGTWLPIDVDGVEAAAEEALAAGRGRRADADLLVVARSAAAHAMADGLGTDVGMLHAVLPDLAPALDALLSPQRLDVAWRLLRAVSRLRMLMRDLPVDPDEVTLTTSSAVVWAALAEVAALTAVEAALADRDGPLAVGDPGESEAAAASVLARRPPMACHARVALEDAVLGEHAVRPGDQVVVLDAGVGGMLAAAGGPYLQVGQQLPAFAATVARAVVRTAPVGARLDVVRSRRSPVTRRPATATLRSEDAA